MNNKSKYEKILIDEEYQSPISGANYQLSVEEYYDLLHHSHKASDIDGIDEVVVNSEVLDNEKATEMIQTMNTLKETVEAITPTIQTLQETINTITPVVESLQESVNSINEYIENDIQIDPEPDDGE